MFSSIFTDYISILSKLRQNIVDFQGIIRLSLQNVIFVAGNEYKTAFHCTVQHKVKYNERNMKLRDKDTKKYLLTVFVATFVAYIIPAVVLYLGHFMGIMLTNCIFPCLT